MSRSITSPRKSIIIFGETAIDTIGLSHKPLAVSHDEVTDLSVLYRGIGGRAANVAMFARAIFIEPVKLLSAIGQDFVQEGFLKQFTQNNLDLTFLYQSDLGQTPEAMIFERVQG